MNRKITSEDYSAAVNEWALRNGSVPERVKTIEARLLEHRSLCNSRDREDFYYRPITYDHLLDDLVITLKKCENIKGVEMDCHLASRNNYNLFFWVTKKIGAPNLAWLRWRANSGGGWIADAKNYAKYGGSEDMAKMRIAKILRERRQNILHSRLREVSI